MGSVEDAMHAAAARQRAAEEETAARHRAIKAAETEFIEAATRANIPRRPLYLLRSYTKRTLFGDRFRQAVEPLNVSGWLVGYYVGDGDFSFAHVVCPDGRVLGSDRLYLWGSGDYYPSLQTALDHDPIEPTPGSTGYLLSNSWNPTMLAVTPEVVAARLGEYLLAAAEKRPIKYP